MKTLKLLAFALVASFAASTVNAQTPAKVVSKTEAHTKKPASPTKKADTANHKKEVKKHAKKVEKKTAKKADKKA